MSGSSIGSAYSIAVDASFPGRGVGIDGLRVVEDGRQRYNAHSDVMKGGVRERRNSDYT